MYMHMYIYIYIYVCIYIYIYIGTLCKDAQRRSARFELRGSIDDYLLTAQDLLAADGRFITVSTICVSTL
jgi:hypothetical protein